MKVRKRLSAHKRRKKTGYRTRQRTHAGRAINRRKRRRHGSF